ncbi:MAG: biotin/lipoyl-containing protein [Bacteroidia bacterium]
MAYEVKVNNKKTFQIEVENGELSLDGRELKIDIHSISENRLHVLYKGKSFRVGIVERQNTKTFGAEVNGNRYSIELKDRYDLLLEKLGLSSLADSGVDEIKAPMPGLVLKVLVEVGEEVQKDTPLMILEAMKMENVLKSPAAGKVKKIEVSQGQAVEKNQSLLLFE